MKGSEVASEPGSSLTDGAEDASARLGDMFGTQGRRRYNIEITLSLWDSLTHTPCTVIASGSQSRQTSLLKTTAH